MKIKNVSEQYLLSSEKIDIMSGTVESFLCDKKIDHREIMKLRISMENALIYWQEKFGSDAAVSLNMKHSLGRETITLMLDGERCDPLAEDGEDIGSWAKTLRSSLEGAPTYDYLGKKNIVHFFAKAPKISRLLLILLYLAAGLLIGLAGNALIPADMRLQFCNAILVPVYNTLLGMFNFCGIPLIFLSVLTGILGVGNINSFNMIGRNMVKYFMKFCAIATGIVLFAGLVIFPQNFGGTGPDVQFSTFTDMIIGWIPMGLFQPFLECNAMQLVLLGLAMGLAILVIDGGTGHISGFFIDFNSMMLTLMGWMTHLIPLTVCLTLIKSMWISEMNLILSAWKLWASTLVVQFIVIAAVAVPLFKIEGVSFKKIAAKVARVFLIALASCTCTVSIPENYDCCENRLGIDFRIFVAGIPIGTSIFKPATAVRVLFMSLFVMQTTGQSITVEWLIVLFIMAIVMSIAAPAIPGGTIMLISMLFAQLGMPEEAMVQIIALDVFFDCFCIAFNQIAVSIGLATYSKKIGLLNEEIIRKEHVIR